MITNNNIANNLIIHGKNTSIEDLSNIINNLSDKDKYFLSNIYVLSRSISENTNKLDNSIYYGTNEQIYVYDGKNNITLKEDIINEFSLEIAELVDGVTKLGKLQYTSKQT